MSTANPAVKVTTLASFSGTDGYYPFAGLVTDGKGDLFGTTVNGGAGGRGTVFEIAKTTSGYANTLTTLTSFDGSNGDSPNADLTIDGAGDLFGTTIAGGAANKGVVFEIPKTSSGYADAPITLASFDGTNGQSPVASLVMDDNGDLFGTTSGDGAGDAGTVFEIPKTSSGYAGAPVTLVRFDGGDGAAPKANLILDETGNLFGTTSWGGAGGRGTVFEIPKTSSGYADMPTTLASFDGTNGSTPFAGLIADGAGNLIGTTYGGGAEGDGTVFEIAKTASGYADTPATLVSFDGTNGAWPEASLIADSKGNLFGTTYSGGASGDGTLFEIARTASGYADTPTTLVSFDGTNGAWPESGLVADGEGNLFGTTGLGGADGNGTVFEVTGSGFVPQETTTPGTGGQNSGQPPGNGSPGGGGQSAGQPQGNGGSPGTGDQNTGQPQGNGGSPGAGDQNTTPPPGNGAFLITGADQNTGQPIASASNSVDLSGNNDNLTLISNTPGAWVAAGEGSNWIQTSGGGNAVVSGGMLTQIINGGGGNNIDFLNTRNQPVAWDAVANFQSGDAIALIGAGPQNVSWQDIAGPAGSNFNGLTLMGFTDGRAACLSLPGLSTADLASGTVAFAFGTDPVNGEGFALIVHG